MRMTKQNYISNEAQIDEILWTMIFEIKSLVDKIACKWLEYDEIEDITM